MDIDVGAFRNVNINFYEYSLNNWLDTKPNLSDLTKWGGTQRVGVVYAPGSAKFKDPGSSSNNLSLSFNKDQRTVFYPGTTVYSVFGNCKEFTYDLEYVTDVNEVLAMRTGSTGYDSSTQYFDRNLVATMERAYAPDSSSPDRLLSFPELSMKVAMPEHMGTSDSFSILIAAFDVITVKRVTLVQDDPLYVEDDFNDTAALFVSPSLSVNPFGDGLWLTKTGIIGTHTRQTVSQTHGAVGGNGPCVLGIGATLGRGIYRFKYEDKTVVEVEIKYLRGYYAAGGTVQLGYKKTIIVEEKCKSVYSERYEAVQSKPSCCGKHNYAKAPSRC